MQILIEIDEEDYNVVKDMSYAFDSLISRLYKSVINGTPLPKNHGRLIDADRLQRIDHIVLESAIDNAPTIIEEVKADE